MFTIFLVGFMPIYIGSEQSKLSKDAYYAFTLRMIFDFNLDSNIELVFNLLTYQNS